MIENLKYIQKKGIEQLLENEQDGNVLPVTESVVFTIKHVIIVSKVS